MRIEQFFFGVASLTAACAFMLAACSSEKPATCNTPCVCPDKPCTDGSVVTDGGSSMDGTSGNDAGASYSILGKWKSYHNHTNLTNFEYEVVFAGGETSGTADITAVRRITSSCEGTTKFAATFTFMPVDPPKEYKLTITLPPLPATKDVDMCLTPSDNGTGKPLPQDEYDHFKDDLVGTVYTKSPTNFRLVLTSSEEYPWDKQ